MNSAGKSTLVHHRWRILDLKKKEARGREIISILGASNFRKEVLMLNPATETRMGISCAQRDMNLPESSTLRISK
jgi:hypothetical protein